MEIAFSRHATSKITTFDDLDSLGFYGFRGEALPSVASVSRLRMVSRPRDADVGTEIFYEGGVLESLGPVAAPFGTSIEVSDLFFNTPARRKFLKTEATESRYLSRIATALAVGRHTVGFSLQLNDGRNLMYYRLRTKGGGADPHSAGSLSDGTGLLRTLGATDVQLRPLGHWQGYPVEWRLHLRGEPNAWRVRALLRDQEMDLSVRYWEGAVEVLSDADGTSLGRGYLELSGYR